MKKFLIRSTVFVVTLILTLMVASRLLNKDRDNLTMEMGRATLPVVTMLWNGAEYNPLYGHVSAVDPASQRDQITILGENRRAEFRIRTYGRIVTKIMAQVRSSDGARLIENIDVTGYQTDADGILAELSIKDLIEQKQEYVISIGLELDGWQQAWYHTRAIWDPDSLLSEELAFVLDFHEKLYHREEAKALVKYLESNSRLEDNTSFHKVNIHSSFKQITWGDLKVSEVRKPLVSLREINGQNATILLNYAVETKGSDQMTRYRMQEYYKIKYAPDRTYLLAFERTMTQIPDEDALYAGDKLLLGIADENVDMMENEDGSVVAFQQADRLFSYQVSTQKLALIFSFYDPDHQDQREEHDEHDVKILRVDAEGSVDFAVWGYMNRGEREGEVGIRICRYDAKINTITETAFIPWDKPYSELKVQLGQLLYLSEDNSLYVYLEHSVYRLNLAEKTYEKLMEAKTDGCMMASADNQVLTWQELTSDGYSREIKTRDLATNHEVVFRGEQGEALRILGFMGQDVIYGVAKKDQITTLATGAELFPMYKLCIARADGTILKEYQQDGIFVISASAAENQIILERMTQKEDGSFVQTTQDHVTKTTQSKSGKNQVSVVDIDVYERYVQIKVNGKIDAKKVQLLTPKEVVQEGEEDFTIPEYDPVPSFRVYGPWGLDGSYVSVGNALLRADEISGTVIDGQGNVIWRKADRSSRNQIMAIREPEKVDAQESAGVCLDTMLRLKGISVDSGTLLAQGKTPYEVLMENTTDMPVYDMTGTNLEAMLYYVSRDIPVLAVLRSGEAVLITGYNESQIVLYQPSAGKLYKKGMTDSAKWFEENGNGFLVLYAQ
ncbi:MAG: hypothetical protein IKS85_06660 [Lachnospiraceae bacterium]|nr:hypothetical protein [Lachnospiraceae bacterium]